MKVYTGTSGYSYKEWKGVFYPEKLPQAKMLNYYSRHFSSVEINSTFYRMPTENLLTKWAGEVPEGFRFVLKASRRISHHKTIADASEEVDYFLRTSAVLGERLGPTLVQLPPYLRQDLDMLEKFLKRIPDSWKAAIEFRHQSWFDEGTYSLLRHHGCALVFADTDQSKVEPEFLPTSDFGYLRLRKAVYDDESLKKWRETVRSQPWSEAYVFFKHEDKGSGPEFARMFQEGFE